MAQLFPRPQWAPFISQPQPSFLRHCLCEFLEVGESFPIERRKPDERVRQEQIGSAMFNFTEGLVGLSWFPTLIYLGHAWWIERDT